MSEMDEPGFRVLLVEDDEDDVLITRKLFSRVGVSRYQIDWVSNYDEGLERLLKGDYDVCLLDYRLGEYNGLELLREAVDRGSQTPFILLTGDGSRELDMEAATAGAADYMVKGEITSPLIERSIRYAIERKRVEKELQKTRRQQLEMKDQFVSHVSHELRSPLTVIHQFVTLLLDGLVGEISDEQREHLDVVLRNTLQLREMISDLLDITRAESGKLLFEQHPVSLVQVFVELERNYRQTATQKGILFLVQQPQNFPRVYADPQRLRQILSNLIGNAFKFTERGKVSIRVTMDNNPGFVRIGVSDTGCGIRPTSIPLIFNRLYQEASNAKLARNGLGLGLHICEQLVKLHGGRIWVESEQGQGSTFFFTIPINKQSYSEKEHRIEQEQDSDN